MEEYIEELEGQIAVLGHRLKQRTAMSADAKLRALNHKLMVEQKNLQRQVKQMEAALQHVNNQNTVLSNIFDALNNDEAGHQLMVSVVRKLHYDALLDEK